jgi:hypothetical protein
MAKLVSDDPGAAPDDMVLEVDRVEDARTIRQRLRIPAAQWRTFAASESAGATPDTAEHAYWAWQGFWDSLATAHADALPAAPLDDPHTQPVAPSAAWLSVRYRDWQSRG